MTSGPCLLEKISGFSEEKIKDKIEEKVETHIQVLRELNLINQDDSVKDITQRVLSVGLQSGDLAKLTAEFWSVCGVVLDIDNPYVEELILLLVLGSSYMDDETKIKKWRSLIEKITETTAEIEPSSYEDENEDKKQQQETLKNQLRGYYPSNMKPEEKSELEQLQCCVQELQKECIRCQKSGEEFGGVLKKPKWQTFYVFGTDKMAQVLRRHLNDIDVSYSTSSEIKDSQFSKDLIENVEKVRKEGFGVCLIRLAVVKSGIEEILDKDKTEGEITDRIIKEVQELKDKPPSKADIMRTLTRHSVGILLWKNHCQASVTCVGKDLVLTAAHIFTPDKSEIWTHLLRVYCEKMFPSSDLKLKTFCNLKEQYYKYKAKSEGNRGTGLEENFIAFIKDQLEKTIKKDILNELSMKKEEKRRMDEDSIHRSEKEEVEYQDIIKELEQKEDEEGRVTASDEVLGQMKKLPEIKKLAEIREEDLVSFHADEIKIHIGHMEDVEDHFKAKCCRYCVKEVILLNHELDVAVLKIAKSTDFKCKEEDIMYIRQEIVPIPITSAVVPNGHMFIAAHPLGKILCMESSVKLLDDSEKSVFVENFITQAILQATSKARNSILRHVDNAGKVFERLPKCVYLDKYKYESKKLVKRNDTDRKILHQESNEETEIDFEKGFISISKVDEKYEKKLIHIKQKNDEEVSKKLLIPGNDLECGKWCDYPLENFWHSNLPKRGDLQIPIPSAKKWRSTNNEMAANGDGKTTALGHSQPCRFILTSRYDEASYACKIIQDDVGAAKKGILRIKKLCNPIIVEESDKPVVLGFASEVVCIKCEIICEKKERLFILNNTARIDCTGRIKLEKLENERPENESVKPVEIRMDKSFDLPELSLSLEKDSEGKLSLHYNFREKRAKSGKTLYFSLIKVEFLNIELKMKNEMKKTSSEEQNSYIVTVDSEDNTKKITVDSEDVTKKMQDRITKNAMKKTNAILLKKKIDSWIGNILLLKRGTNGHKSYCSLEVQFEIKEETKRKISYTAKWQESRKWTLEDDSQETYVVWPTFSWATDFVLQFCKMENSRVTLSIHDTYDSYRITEFDPNEKQLLRQTPHLLGNPIVPGIIIYVENKRLGKLVSPYKGMKSLFVQTLKRSFSNNDMMKKIVTEEIKKSGKNRYIRMKELHHIKLIGMEHGASGGACCFIGEQGKLLLHGMFLGACPSFYYNNAESKLFFNKTGTCFNEVLPSYSLIEELKKLTPGEQIKARARLVPNSQIPGSFFISAEN